MARRRMNESMVSWTVTTQTAASGTLNTGDIVNGGSGTDTLNITVIDSDTGNAPTWPGYGASGWLDRQRR